MTVELIRPDEDSLQTHVKLLSEEFHPRDFLHVHNLDRCAEYILAHFKKANAASTHIQAFSCGAGEYKNVRAFFGRSAEERIVIGAHYDTCGDTPGADDNASGIAGLIELAYLLGQHSVSGEVELVAYSLEEPPFFGTEYMGSAYHAKSLAEEGISVKIMMALEMIGYFTDEEGSQRFPLPMMNLMYPTRGNFIALAGRFEHRRLMKAAKAAMQKVIDVPVVVVAVPSWMLGVDFSDHRNYWKYGYPALMVTDTAFYRNFAYHCQNDTADRLDYGRMAQIVAGIYTVITNLINVSSG